MSQFCSPSHLAVTTSSIRLRLCDSRHGLAIRLMLTKQSSLHHMFINLVANLMEQVLAELVRLATELESVRGQVQTECNALRDLFRTKHSDSGKVAARSPPEPQRGGERHLPQQFGGHRVDHGDFAFRVEGYAAVLSRDGQGGAL